MSGLEKSFYILMWGLLVLIGGRELQSHTRGDGEKKGDFFLLITVTMGTVFCECAPPAPNILRPH